MSLDQRGRAAGSAMRNAVEHVSAPNPVVVIRRRARRRRVQASVLAVVVLLVAGAVTIPLLTRDDDRLTVATPPSRTTDQSQVADRFVPSTTTSGDTTTMPITLPDGRPYTVSYAKGLELAKLGFRSTVAARSFLSISSATSARTLSVLRTTAAQRYGALKPVATYPGAHGQPVPYYVDPAAPERSGLAVQIGPWLVVVPDLDDPANNPEGHLSPSELADWAARVNGWVNDAGFLVLAPRLSAFTLDQSAKGSFVLGPASRSKNNVAIGEHWLCTGPGTDTTTPRRFPPTPRGAAKGAAWCDRATGLHVTVVGTQRFVDGMIRSFRLAPFSTAPRATRILLAAKRVTAGSTLPGVVVVVNNTGAPLSYGTCGKLLEVALTKPGGLSPSGGGAFACLVPYTVPQGQSTFPVVIDTEGRAPGRYDAVLVRNDNDLPAAPPISVRVTAAPR